MEKRLRFSSSIRHLSSPIVTFRYLVLMVFILTTVGCQNAILIEAEHFDDKGGWVVDPQFVEQMGSPFLMAHGMGQPVESARTEIDHMAKGNYHVWVRTRNWAPGEWESPGRFTLKIEHRVVSDSLGIGPEWDWEYAGVIELDESDMDIEVIDRYGFNARFDAICLTGTREKPPTHGKELAEFRRKALRQSVVPENFQKFDLVVVGGGLTGCAAAIAAAEQGLEVALIHDRPVLGGNASSEIRVHTLGVYGHFERILKMLDTEHYPNGAPESKQDEEKRHDHIESYDNIHLFLNWRAYATQTRENKIVAVDAAHTYKKKRMRFSAPLFVDCTGDGWIGYWAGAEYSYGRESHDQYGESWDRFGSVWSPDQPDRAVMGSSILWRTREAEDTVFFPEVPWAMEVVGDFSARKGTWHWELIRDDLHQIDDGETIRDHMLKAIFGSFFNEKQKPGTETLELEWVSYLLGKRESRRLVGDHIYTFNDMRENRQFPDSVVVEVREVDVHYPQKLLNPARPDFLSEAMFYPAGKYYIPYRSLYSKNIENLFMAGRCFSCSHVGLGGPRVMRTTGQMGAAVGLAAAICKEYDVLPRGVYEERLEEYMRLVMGEE